MLSDLSRALSHEPTKRNAAFKQYLLAGEVSVHRLRDWEQGDTLWGYRTVTDGGAGGKTYREGSDRMIETGAEGLARSAYEDAVDLAADGTAVFLYSATIDRVYTATMLVGQDEPAEKHAMLSGVEIHKSYYAEP